jgi:hypothetical protein
MAASTPGLTISQTIEPTASDPTAIPTRARVGFDIARSSDPLGYGGSIDLWRRRYIPGTAVASFVGLRPQLDGRILALTAGQLLCRLGLHRWTERKNSDKIGPRVEPDEDQVLGWACKTCEPG